MRPNVARVNLRRITAPLAKTRPLNQDSSFLFFVIRTLSCMNAGYNLETGTAKMDMKILLIRRT